MASFNRVIIAGNLTRDPEIRYTPSGTAVSEIGLAISRKYKQGNETKEETTFVDVTLWGRQAELAGDYLAKGRPVLIEGRLQLDQWQDQDGSKRQKLKVVAEQVQFLWRNQADGNGNGGGNSGGSPQQRQQAPQHGSAEWDHDGFYDDDAIPF